MTDDFIRSVTERYIELYEKITGETFVPSPQENLIKQIENNINNAL